MDYHLRVEKEFLTRFHEKPLLVRSPGRVNIIGEHTDYNEGFVLPAAIDRAIYFALAPRPDRHVVLVALNRSEQYESKLGVHLPPSGWQNYILGVADLLLRDGARIAGFNCVFGGDIPIGAGLSSSAALEAGVAYGLNVLFELGYDRLELARIAQQAEHEYIGVKCGIMDQYANLFGAAGTALKLDCRTLTHQSYTLDPELRIVLFNTGVTHNLVASEYNRRRAECQEGVTRLQQWYPKITHLRDVTAVMLDEHRASLPPVIYRRCHYVVAENERVEEACHAIQERDNQTLGDLLYASHHGLQYEYEVSCPELDFLVAAVQPLEGVIGARLMGGGFGGCTINLIHHTAVAEVCRNVVARYEQRFARPLEVYITQACAGTQVESR